MIKLLEEILLEKQYESFTNPATIEEIKAAEDALSLKFSDDYKLYLLLFGTVTFKSHELTGICNNARLNVKDVTFFQRQYHPEFDTNLYVIEELNYDDCIVWQNKSGTVYESSGLNKPQFLCDSLYEYIELQ